MKKIKEYIKIEYLFITILLIGSFYLRFKNLGYSDYIGDEHKAFMELSENETTWEFFMNQRKGPMQFLISHIPYSITGDFRNELAQRIPFSIISVMSVLVFYFLVKKLTKESSIAFISAFLFMVNGFTVGFGRIAQYQNLNLLFSFLALYFYSSLLEKKPARHRTTKEDDAGGFFLKHSLLGTLFWSLSFLSHWDAIFILPVVLIIFIKYFIRKDINVPSKWKLIGFNLLFGCILLLPFLIPYTRYQLSNSVNSDYFERRIEIGHSLNDRYRLLIDLYNPFLTFWFLIIAGCLGILFIRKSYIHFIWFLFTYGSFELFVRKPGTHIYNFLIPVFILSGVGIVEACKIFPKLLKGFLVTLMVLTFGFLFYQSHFVFINHAREYPWQEKTFYEIQKPPKWLKEYSILKTPIYSYDQKLPLFGFPHKRYWSEINEYINNKNTENNETYGYMTNEVKTISEWYMDAKYKANRGFYVVGIKDPLSFVNDWRFMQIGGKELVYKIRNEDGDTVVRIYRVEK